MRRVPFNTRFGRFLLNGAAAAAVHYSVLIMLLELLKMPSAGLANGIAALFGISTSYLGNKVFVFQSTASHARTLPSFLLVYALVALLHAGILLLWTDYAKLPYTFGFLIAAGAAIVLTYFGNRGIVFKTTASQGAREAQRTN